MVIKNQEKFCSCHKICCNLKLFQNSQRVVPACAANFKFILIMSPYHHCIFSLSVIKFSVVSSVSNSSRSVSRFMSLRFLCCRMIIFFRCRSATDLANCELRFALRGVATFGDLKSPIYLCLLTDVEGSVKTIATLVPDIYLRAFMMFLK